MAQSSPLVGRVCRALLRVPQTSPLLTPEELRGTPGDGLSSGTAKKCSGSLCLPRLPWGCKLSSLPGIQGLPESGLKHTSPGGSPPPIPIVLRIPGNARPTLRPRLPFRSCLPACFLLTQILPTGPRYDTLKSYQCHQAFLKSTPAPLTHTG